MAELSSDQVDALITSSLDQDWEKWVDHYDTLTPIERGAMAKWLIDHKPPPDDQEWIAEATFSLAQCAFLEVARRWAARSSEGT